MVKGFGCDRKKPLPSLLPSRAHIFCWRGRWSTLRGSDVFDTIINQPQEYRKIRSSVSTARNSWLDSQLLRERLKPLALPC